MLTLHRTSQTLRWLQLCRRVQSGVATLDTRVSVSFDPPPNTLASTRDTAPGSAPSTHPHQVICRGFAAATDSTDECVTVVESDVQFREIIAEHHGKKPCIVDFYAIWCGPCRQISPYFEELARSYSGLRFLKVDVDKLNEVTAEAAVNAVPAFQVWKDGAVVDEFVGASKEDLRALCEKHQFEEGELEGDK